MHDGTGTGWTETDPQNSEDTGDGAQEIRDLRKGVRIRLEKEHEIPAASSAGGEHKKGSGVAFYQNTQPTVRPDGATALAAADAGRLWIKKGSNTIYVKNDVDEAFIELVPHAGSITKTMLADGFTGSIIPIAILEEQADNNTNGGNFTNSGWRVRILDRGAGIYGVLASDNGSIVDTFDAATGTITLTAGTYRVRAMAQGYRCGGHQLRFRNITDSTTPGLGTTALAYDDATGVMTQSELMCEFTITATKNFQLQHFCNTTRNTDGFGKAAATGIEEIYARCEIYKLL